MNIDMGALHAIEVDRGISVEELLETIKSALLTAYRHTEGHEAEARIDIDRKSGIVRVLARETDGDGNSLGKRIHAAKAQRAPYVIVLGDKEVESGTLTIETRTEKLEGITAEDFITRVEKEIKEKILN